MLNRRHFFRTFAVTPLVAAGAGAKAQPAEPPAVPPWPDDSDPKFWDRLREQFYLKPGEA